MHSQELILVEGFTLPFRRGRVLVDLNGNTLPISEPQFKSLEAYLSMENPTEASVRVLNAKLRKAGWIKVFSDFKVLAENIKRISLRTVLSIILNNHELSEDIGLKPNVANLLMLSIGHKIALINPLTTQTRVLCSPEYELLKTFLVDTDRIYSTEQLRKILKLNVTAAFSELNLLCVNQLNTPKVLLSEEVSPTEFDRSRAVYKWNPEVNVVEIHPAKFRQVLLFALKE